MTERTTVRLPPELLDRARKKALAEKRTLTSLIEEGLQLALAPQKPIPADKAPFPISTHKGEFVNGVNIIKTSEIDEVDDIEMVKRYLK